MFERRERLKELFQKEITKALAEVKDPGISGFLTVTDLELSADQKTAQVYYSILGTAAQRASTDKALTRAAPYLRQVIKKRVKLRMIPIFTFIYDETPYKASRVDELLLRLEREDRRD